MVQLLNNLYLGASTPDDYGTFKGGVELLHGYYIGAAVPSGKPSYIDVILSGVSPLTLVNAVTDGLNYVKLFGATKQGDLPSGYTRLEYIESTGTQYIDTGVLHENLIVEYEALTTNSSTASQIFLATSLSSFWVGWKSGKPSCGVEIDLDATQKRKYRVTYTTNNITLMDIETGLTGTTTNGYTNDTLRLFSWSGGSFSSYTQLYSCKMFEGTTLVRNYIPCRRNIDSVLGMYDTVTGTFSTNQGTGIFTAGADIVPSPENPTDIVCNNGVVKVSPNLINYTTFEPQTSAGITITLDSDGTFTVNGISTATYYSAFSIPCVLPAGTYTLSAFNSEVAQGSTYQQIGLMINGSMTGRLVTLRNINPSKTFTTTDNSVNLEFRFTGSFENFKFKIQLEKGDTATTYMPYGQTYTDGTYETVTVDTTGDSANAEMLLSVSNYKDVQSVLDGGVTRNVGIKVLDGTEDWFAYNGGAGYRTTVQDMMSSTDGVYLCTHAIPISSVASKGIRFGASNKVLYWCQINTTFTTVDIFKAWLATQYANGTPVIVIYPLETPTTESVTPQSLSIQDGTNVITAEGSIDDLTLEVSYKSGAVVTVEEIEAVNLDNDVEVTIN